MDEEYDLVAAMAGTTYDTSQPWHPMQNSTTGSQKSYIPNPLIVKHAIGAPAMAQPNYYLVQVQLTEGDFVMTISLPPGGSTYDILDRLAKTGYLHLSNPSETVLIKADRVVAVKFTKLTSEEK